MKSELVQFNQIEGQGYIYLHPGDVVRLRGDKGITHVITENGDFHNKQVCTFYVEGTASFVHNKLWPTKKEYKFVSAAKQVWERLKLKILIELERIYDRY
jgi:hypothetical protein